MDDERELAQLGRVNEYPPIQRNYRLAVIDVASETEHGLSVRTVRLATLEDVEALIGTIPQDLTYNAREQET